jgi:hypothetical protein
MTSMRPILPSASVHSDIDELLLRGEANSASEAENIYLDAHLVDLAQLVIELDDDAFTEHEAIKLLMSHGSRRREDALRAPS